MRELEIALAAVRIYAESHPRPSHVNQQQAAEMIGVSRHTVGRMLKAGTLRFNKLGMIPIREIDEAIASKK
jgi:excisionase family DNA binding protein